MKGEIVVMNKHGYIQRSSVMKTLTGLKFRPDGMSIERPLQKCLERKWCIKKSSFYEDFPELTRQAYFHGDRTIKESI